MAASALIPNHARSSKAMRPVHHNFGWWWSSSSSTSSSSGSILCIHAWLFFLLLASCFHTCLLFDLEGSQTSYAKFPKWNPCLNGSLSFEFQTLQPNALLMYGDDGGRLDFIEVKIVGGVVRLRINLGEGAIILSAGLSLNDDRWHKVEVVRNYEETTLIVDNVAQTRTSKGSEVAFGNMTQNSYVFVGGMPIAWSARLSALALPSVMFEPRFRGSFRNLFYSNCGGPMERVEMLDSEGVRTNGLDQCSRMNPCRHEGVCISTDTGTICDCSRTDYEGTFCETEKLPSIATFYGAHFLSYDLSSRGDPIISSKDEVSMWFKTRQPNGLLFYTGDGDDFMNVALREGGVLVHINLGSGLFETDIKPRRGSVRFDDNLWHRLVITREAREVTVQLDDMFRRTGTTVGEFTMLSSNQLYVAGSQDVGALPGSQVIDNFRGCMKKVVYKADSISLDLTDLARNNHNLLSVQGDVLFNKCDDLIQSQPVTFTDPESLLRAPGWSAVHSGSVEFQFRTTEPNGLIMYNMGVTGTTDFFGLEILNGYLYVLFDLGSGVVKVRASNVRLTDGLPHKVMLDHSSGAGTVDVDGSSVSYQVPGGSDQLDLEGDLFVGGIDHEIEPAVLDRFPEEMWTARLKYGYVGCLQDLVINGEKVDLAGLAAAQEVLGVVKYCRVLEPQCISQPCMHRGDCSEGWNRYTCDCRETGYIGESCNEVATTASFDGTQYLTITLPNPSRTQVEDISIRFRTSRPNGLIFATISAKTTDRLELMLEGGKLRYDVNLGSGSKSVYASRGLDDDQWHTVTIKRRAQHISLKVDNITATEDTIPTTVDGANAANSGSKRHESTSAQTKGDSRIVEFDKIEVAKRPPDEETLRSRENFVGYMQQFVFNGEHYFEMARTGSQGIATTAKFDKKDKLVHFPLTFKSPGAYLTTRLQLYATFTIYFQVKTTQPNGLILYSGGRRGKDFIALEMVKGHIRYVYDLGSGPRVVRSALDQPINDNKWHDIGILRPTLQQHILRVDESASFDNLPDSRAVHFDTNGVIFIGGVDKQLYTNFPKHLRSREGFQGCLASLDLDGDSRNILEHGAEIPTDYQDMITEGCEGPTSKCSPTSCKNGGTCMQEWNSYTCDCDMTSFTGPTCEEDGIAYWFGGQDGGLVTLSFPENAQPDTKRDTLALGIVTTQKDGVILRISSGNSNDYIEMEMVDGNIFVVYNMGTMDHPVGELFEKVNDGHYHVVRFTRSGPNSTIQIDDLVVQTKNPAGQQLTIFNSQKHVMIGGRRDQRGKISRPFRGIIAGVALNGLRILDLASEGDPRVTIEGDVVLEIGPLRPAPGVTRFPPSRPVIGTPAPGELSTSSMLSTMGTTPRGDGVTDDIIFSGVGSGCSSDDEDDCAWVGSGDRDALVKPIIKVTTTPAPSTTRQPWPTPTPRSGVREPTPIPSEKGSGGDPCDNDDEDCGGSGSGHAEPVHTPRTNDGGGNNGGFSSRTTTKRPWGPEEPWVPGGGPSETLPIDETRSTDRPRSTTDNMVITVNMTETPPKKPTNMATRRPYDPHTDPPDGPDMEGRPDISPTPNEKQVNQQPKGYGPLGLNIGLIIGIAAGILLLLLILAYALYKYKSRDEGSYKIDESKNYQYPDTVSKSCSQVNGGVSKSGMQASKPKSKKDVKEWYV